MTIQSECSQENDMNGEVKRRKVVVRDPVGFHLRPLTVFAQKALQFKECNVFVSKDNQKVNGKSPLELMLLQAHYGTELLLEVSGPESDQAIEVLAELLSAPGTEEDAESSVPKKG